MDMAKMPALEDIAKCEGGSIDKLWDTESVLSPINAYFVPTDANVLAVLSPADRRAATKWVRTPAKPDGNVTSAYIKTALSTLGDKTDVMMVLELEGT